MSRYELDVDGAKKTVSEQDGAGIYALPSGEAGMHTLSVIAYDKAGNSVGVSGRFISTAVSPRETSSALGTAVWAIVNSLSLKQRLRSLRPVFRSTSRQ